MSQIFISHVQEDITIALEIALHLEEAGYTTWCYELDYLGGVKYTEYVVQEIEKCNALLLVISPESLGS